VDLTVFAALLGLLFRADAAGPSPNAPFRPKTAALLHMFIGLFLSIVFTFVYATAAARLRRAGKVLIPRPESRRPSRSSGS
jgi:NitT/TauT family transport system permease protein